MASLNVSSIGNVSLPTDALGNFTFADFSIGEYFSTIKPLLLFVIGMTIYAIFIFKFYRFLARKDVLQLKTKRFYAEYEGVMKRMFRSFFYVLENLIIIPLLVFFWFVVLALLLMFLGKNQDAGTILLIAASIVAAIRVTAYYNENLSQDLAKMIPFALLGVFLVDFSYFSVGGTLEMIKQIPSLWKQFLYYLLFVVGLEFILRIVHGLATLFILREVAKGKEELLEE